MVTGSTFLQGNSSTNSGGAIYSNGGNISLATTTGNVTIIDNTTTGMGGAINDAAASSIMTIGNAGSTVLIGVDSAGLAAGNVATDAGGALYSGGTTTINGALINVSNNKTTGSASGGAIWSGQTVSINGSLIAGNNSAGGSGNGGFIFMSSATGAVNIGQAGATIAIGVDANGIAAGNKATNGGAVYSNNTVAITGNATLSNNIASAAGGGIYASSAVTIVGSLRAGDNVAGTNGGAIYSPNNVSVTAAGTTSFTGNSAGAKGGAIYAGGNVTLDANGGDMTFSRNTHGDPVANAVYLNNTAGASIASFNAAAGRTITFYDPVQNNVVNGLVTVNKTGAGTVSFDGSLYGNAAEQWSQIYGVTNVQAGTFEVANNAVYGTFAADVGRTVATSFTSTAGTMVQGGIVGTIRADEFTLNGDLSVAGRQPGSRGVFNISTNNLTLGGGTVYFNTWLNDGAVQNTDLLVLNLNGAAISGQSFIEVANAGGPGGLTVGDGIKLVETNGSGTTTGAFQLGGRVVSGAYEYNLFYGGDASTGGDATDQNWYLRSTYTPPPTPDNPDPRPVPNIRVEVPVSMVIPPLALEYGYTMLDTLHERVGETWVKPMDPVSEERIVRGRDGKTQIVRVPVATANGPDQTRWASSGWARLIGERGFRDNDNFFRRGADYSYTFSGLQAGLDLYGRDKADGTLDKAGIYVGIGQISSDVKGAFGGKAGTVDMDAYTVGGYWTHFASSGWYTDAVIQGTWYSADAKSVYGQQIKPEGFGIIASLETGYSFKLGNNWTLEPQAQLAYQRLSFDSARDQFGFVSFDDGESLRGRLGLRMTKTWNMADEAKPRLLATWLRANVWHEFLSDTKTSFGSIDGQNMVPFRSSLGGTWGELGVGVSGQVTESTSLFASAAYNRSLDNKGRESWDGRLGMTVKW